MSIDLNQATSILSSYSTTYRDASQTLMTQRTNLQTQMNTLSSLIASGASQEAISAQAQVVNNLQTQIGASTNYLKTLNSAKLNALTVLQASSNVVGVTGPTTNPLVGQIGPTGPTGPAGAPVFASLDSTPTQGSTKPITSGGAYTAVNNVRNSSTTVIAGTSENQVVDSNVKCLFHFNGSDSLSFFNGASLSTSVKKFGVSSLNLTGTGTSKPYCTGPSVTIGASTPFSIEYWVYPSTVPLYGKHVVISTSSFHVQMNGTSNSPKVSIDVYCPGVAATYPSPPLRYFISNFELNKWYHICVSRNSSNVISLYVNGVLGSVAESSSSLSGTLIIGGSGINEDTRGYIDELRVTVGSSKVNDHTFSVPTGEYTNTIATFPSPCTQGQLWSNKGNVYVCTVSGNPGTWKQIAA